MTTVNTIEGLFYEAKNAGAHEEMLKLINQASSLSAFIENCSQHMRVLFLRHGFKQFVQGWDWRESILLGDADLVCEYLDELEDFNEGRDLPAEEWALLLLACPGIAHFAANAWGKFTSDHWRVLLIHDEELAKYCKLEELHPSDLADVLVAHPGLATRDNLRHVLRMDWAALLVARKDLADRCPWSTFNVDTILRVLEAHPGLWAHVKTDQLSDYDKCRLLVAHPDHIHMVDISGFSQSYKGFLLDHAPGLHVYMDVYDIVDHRWLAAARRNPELRTTRKWGSNPNEAYMRHSIGDKAAWYMVKWADARDGEERKVYT